MYQTPKYRKEPRKTKRQLKKLRGSNSAMKLSANSKIIKLSDREYLGSNPAFRNMSTVENPTIGFKKVRNGVPFVRRDHL